METGKPHIVTDLECPFHKELHHVEFGVNVFRGMNHEGLDVTACSQFLASQGAVTCGKMCVHTDEARSLYEHEAEKHRDDLAKIGRNVLG
jgi:hypothetical protein